MAVKVAAFVIAGGQSSRMGRDKAFLEFEGRTLLDRALTLARRVSDRVKIVGRRDKFAAYGDVVEDVYPGQGPLAGIHAALSSSASEFNLMIGVDMPFLEARFLKFLIAVNSGATVTVPVTGRQAQPLCAIYRRGFAVVAEEALKQQSNNIVPLFARVTTREIGDSELQRMSFDPIMFENLNTPEEWEKARERAQKILTLSAPTAGADEDGATKVEL